MIQKPSRRFRRTALLLGYSGIFFILFLILFRGLMHDNLHLQFAREWALTGIPHNERPGFEFMVLLAGGFSSDPAVLFRAGILVLAGMALLKMLFSIYMISRECSFPLSILLSVVATFVAPITLPWENHPLVPGLSAVHLGQFSGFIIHSTTTIAVFPFTLMLFYFSVKERMRIVSLLAALSCLIKPNFVLAWAPVFVLFQFWKHGITRQTASKLFFSLFPCLIILGVQFFVTKSQGQEIRIAPFDSWRDLSNNIPVSIARSIAFPLAFTAIYVKELRPHREFWFAWAILLVALIQYSLFTITGDTYKGNWSWGRYLAVYIVFLLCLIRFARILLLQPALGSWREIAKKGSLILLVLMHFGTGLIYYIQGVLFHKY